MPSILVFAFALLWSAPSLAFDLPLPGKSGSPIPSGMLSLRIFQLHDVLPLGGVVECRFLSNSEFGYLVQRSKEGLVTIDIISHGKLEGEKTRAIAEIKPYGDPFTLYLSKYSRAGDYGSYFEILIKQKIDPVTGGHRGDVMFTEAYYSMVDGVEKEVLKPQSKQPLNCELSPGEGI